MARRAVVRGRILRQLCTAYHIQSSHATPYRTTWVREPSRTSSRGASPQSRYTRSCKIRPPVSTLVVTIMFVKVPVDQSVQFATRTSTDAGSPRDVRCDRGRSARDKKTRGDLPQLATQREIDHGRRKKELIKSQSRSPDAPAIHASSRRAKSFGGSRVKKVTTYCYVRRGATGRESKRAFRKLFFFSSSRAVHCVFTARTRRCDESRIRSSCRRPFVNGRRAGETVIVSGLSGLRN